LGCAEEPRWTSQELGIDAQLRDVYFLDSERGWIVGGGYPVEGGLVGSTIDGGRSWSFQSGLVRGATRPESVSLQAVCFLDQRRGFIAAADGRLLRTVDGGQNWHAAHRAGRRLLDLYFVDDLHGWAVGGSVLIRTVDGGESWRAPLSAESRGSLSARAIQFSNRELGWSVGSAGGIYRSSDGGESWASVIEPVSGRPGLWALSFPDAEFGWVAGEEGTLLHTRDGGMSWTAQDSGTDSHLTGVHFRDRESGWAVGFDRSDSSSIVLHTLDGGVSWSPQQRVEGEALFALTFDESGRGWAVGERVLPHAQRLWRYEPPSASD
jgi:photosystem II stability/assembly factor-like uncharacterized protein